MADCKSHEQAKLKAVLDNADEEESQFRTASMRRTRTIRCPLAASAFDRSHSLLSGA